MLDFPYTEENAAIFSLIYCCTFVIGLILSTAILYAILKERQKLLTKKLDQMIYLVILFTWIRSGIMSFLLALAINEGGFDETSCNATGFVLGITLYPEITGQVLMSLELFFTVVRRKPLCCQTFFGVFWGCFLFILIICSIQLLPGFQYAPRGGAICNFQFLSSDLRLEITGLWATCYVLVSVIILTFCYFRTYFDVKATLQEASEYNVNPIYQKAEFAVFVRCASISVAFIICYTFQQGVRLYNQITLKQAPTIVGQIAILLANCDCVSLPLVLIVSSREHRRAFFHYVFFHRVDLKEEIICI